jgi:hypothetical protein
MSMTPRDIRERTFEFADSSRWLRKLCRLVHNSPLPLGEGLGERVRAYGEVSL